MLKKLFRLFRVRESAWLATRPKVNLVQRPVNLTVRMPRLVGFALMGFGGFWLATTWQVLSGGLTASFPGNLVGLLLPAIGACVLVAGVVSLTSSRSITFGRDEVGVFDRGLLGTSKWRLPYEDFEGVMLRERIIRRKNSTRIYQIVELRHSDRERSLPLWVQRGSDTPRAEWEATARALDLPTLVEGPEGVVIRKSDEIDLSLKEQAERGSLALDESYRQTPPAGLVTSKVSAPEEAILVMVERSRIPLPFLLLFIGISGGLLIFSLASGKAWPVMFIAGLFFLGASYLWHKDRTGKRKLRISRNAIEYEDPWPWDRKALPRLCLEEIEAVRVRRCRSNMGNELVIESDRGHIALGPGLGEKANAWLKSLITSAVATA